MTQQTEMHRSARGRVMAMDSAYHVEPANCELDVVVNASYCGVLPARFIGEHRPRATIGVDCGVGPAGAAIAGLWYLEALNIPAAVADVMTVRLGDGVDLYEKGIISFANRPATDCGLQPIPPPPNRPRSPTGRSSITVPTGGWWSAAIRSPSACRRTVATSW
jgi:hypothetical protein